MNCRAALTSSVSSVPLSLSPPIYVYYIFPPIMIVSANVSPDVVPPVPLTHFLLTINAWVLAISRPWCDLPNY